MTHDDLVDLVPVYALDALEGEERLTVRAHLESCLRCRETLAAYQQAAGHLALAVEPVAPPAALKQRLLAELAATEQPVQLSRQPRRRFAWQKVASLAAVAALLAFGGITYTLVRHLNTTNGEIAQQRALIAAIANPHETSVPLVSTTGGASASGRVVATGHGRAVLVAAGLANPGDRIYQAWLITGAHVSPLVAFRPDRSGDVVVAFSVGSGAGPASIAVTLEPRAGDQTPQGPKVLQSV
jgi:anti-sigma-K factor RskA